MSGDKKSTDAGLSAAERKAQRSRRRKKRSPISKKRKGLFMKTGSAYGKNVCGGR